MRITRTPLIVAASITAGLGLSAQTPGAPAAQAPAAQAARRGPPQVMTLRTTAWVDGGVIPVLHSQAGPEVSPALSWSGAPADTASFVLMVHDVDVAAGSGEDMLHWMLWNIPATSQGLPQGVPQGNQVSDGTRQMSVTGPYYRGPGAAAAGPAHHYVFEIYAPDTMIDVAPVGASPSQTRAAVTTAMAGHVRGKGALVGLFKRAG